MPIVMHTFLHGLAGLGYLFLAAWAWRTLAHPATTGGHPRLESAALALILLIHGTALGSAMYVDRHLHFGFALAISLTLWIGVAIFWVESFFVSMGSLRMLILPIAALGAGLAMLFPDRPVMVRHSLAFTAHWILALLAYGTLAIAALHALLMMAVDRGLHAPEGGTVRTRRLVSRILDDLPPLLTMERLLFRLIGAGFVLLSCAVLAGVVFSEVWMGRAMRFDHKTVFTLLAWTTFGTLLAGRALAGWRGKTALRWTLAGFGFMWMAYIGSRFVLEVVLHR